MTNLSNKQKPLVTVTLEEFVQALRDTWTSDIFQNEAVESSRKFIHGLKELANFLGCSLSTAARIHKSGVLLAATFKAGKIIMFDEEMVLDLLQVSKHKCRISRGNF